jgi:hypothetical protein
VQRNIIEAHIRPIFALVLYAAAVPLASAQVIPASPELASILNFEAESTAERLPGWQVIGSAAPDSAVVHSGRRAARIGAKEGSAVARSTIYLEVETGFLGKTLELRGFVRAENVTDSAELFLRLLDVEGKYRAARSGFESGAPKDPGGWRRSTSCCSRTTGACIWGSR